jgi:hypothetical protein
MLPPTILIDEAPRCVVRPTDTKDLNRFIRNGKTYLLAENPNGKITHRNADQGEAMRWRNASRCTRLGEAPMTIFSGHRCRSVHRHVCHHGI